MNKKKYLCICAVCAMFIIFVILQHSSNTTFDVLQVQTPFKISIDFNKNGVIDEDETVDILSGYQYIDRANIKSGKYKNISTDDYALYALSYLSEKFANDSILDKKVLVKDTKHGKEIYIGNDSYNELLLKSGYIFKNDKPVDFDSYKKRLEYIKKADFKLYNAKSNKYHCLNCKYGLMAHNFVILSKNQLPSGAKPCKYCLGDKQNSKHKRKNGSRDYVPPKVKCPPLSYSNGAIKVFVTDFTTKLVPDRKGKTVLCDELVRQINTAKTSIDIAIYGYDRVPRIENAIRRAIARGVKVRLVYDIDSHNSNIYANTNDFARLIKNTSCDKAPANYPKPAQYTNSIMHDKFYIFDKSIVMTGSANLSFTDMSGFNSNSVILIHSAKAAEIFTKEFEQMYNGKFHKLKLKIPNKEHILIGKTKLSVYFSPADYAIERVIVPIVNKAQRYIYMPVFLITDKRLAAALINAKNRGVDVRVIVDATNAKGQYSKHRLLRQHGILVKTENYGGCQSPSQTGKEKNLLQKISEQR